jgi:hypothetical protein
MKRFVQVCGWTLLLALAVSGCARGPYYFQYTQSHPPPEPHFDALGRPLSRAELTVEGRWLKRVEIRSEPYGARIMVAGFYVGETPMTVEIPCTPGGRFTRTTKVRLIPNEAGGLVQSRLFPAGARVPSRMFFEKPPMER